MFSLTVEQVQALHDAALNPGELPGLARHKSLAGALGRVENRLQFGLIDDVFDLAAAYAMAIAQGQCFNDANKRTAFRAVQVCLAAHGILIPWSPALIGDKTIALARGKIDDGDLADWLRDQPRNSL